MTRKTRSSGPSGIACVLIGVVWAVWHLPLYGIDGTFQHDDIGLWSVSFWALTLGLVPTSVLLVWLVQATRGALSVAVVAHALTNVAGELVIEDGLTRGVELGLLIVAAVTVPLVWRRHSVGRHTGWSDGDGRTVRHAP